MTILEHIGVATTDLVDAGLPPDTATIDAEALARHVLGWNMEKYLSNRQDAAPAPFANRYSSVLNRRMLREPVALIVGHREFWGLKFEVAPTVLTPRPETELLVEETLDLFGNRSTEPFHLVDVGTGSGCVSVALALELPSVRITATDISHDALTVAHRNAVRHGVADRITWLHTPYFNSLSSIPDVIVTNPAYVPDAQVASLPPEVRDFEPRVAIAGGHDGLDVIRTLLEIAVHRLAPGGHLVMEFGIGQLETIQNAVRGYHQLEVRKIRNDLQDIPRAIVVKHTVAPIEAAEIS